MIAIYLGFKGGVLYISVCFAGVLRPSPHPTTLVGLIG